MDGFDANESLDYIVRELAKHRATGGNIETLK